MVSWNLCLWFGSAHVDVHALIQRKENLSIFYQAFIVGCLMSWRKQKLVRNICSEKNGQSFMWKRENEHFSCFCDQWLCYKYKYEN